MLLVHALNSSLYLFALLLILTAFSILLLDRVFLFRPGKIFLDRLIAWNKF